ATPPVKAPEAESVLRIGILADFSGRTSRAEQRSAEEILEVKPRGVDRENLEEVMARFEVRLELPLPDSNKKGELTFRNLEEFPPDEIYRQVDQFDDCRETEEKSALMNALFHHPFFQGLESAWLGVDWLLKRVLKRDSRIEVVLYDLSLDEVRANLMANED